MEFRVFGLIHHTHPTAAQLLDNAVVRDGLANHVFPVLPFSSAPVIVRRSDADVAGTAGKRGPEVDMTTPSQRLHVIQRFASFPARLSWGTRSRVWRLRVPSALGRWKDQSAL